MSARTVLKIFLTVGAILSVAVPVCAQDSTITGWKKTLVVDLTGTQTAYSDSWVGGELGALSWVGNLNGMAEKQLTLSLNFQSRLKLSFGQTYTQKSERDPITGAEKKFWEKPKKSTDLIDWENVGRLTKGWVVDPYLAVRFESQFLDASYELKKRYLNPKKLTESAGIARKLYAHDKDQIISRFGFAFRQIFRNVIIDTAALKTTDSTLTDGGFESVTDVNLSLRKNVQYTGKLTLYKALFFSKENEVKGTPYANYWKAIDVNWENIFAASITKLITVNFYVQFLYDKEIELRGRLKETLGIGFVYKML
jgi:hypothetical protein